MKYFKRVAPDNWQYRPGVERYEEIMDDNLIKQNMQARQDAEALLGFVNDCIDSGPGIPYNNRMCELILEGIKKYLSPKLLAEEKKPIVPMTEQEAIDFENRPLTFGSYADVLIGTVPTSYLTWYSELPDWDLKLFIKRYFKSQRGIHRLREEEE